MFLQRQFMYFDFHSTLKRNVPPANGFGPVSLNACNNILTADWEGLFSDKSAIDVQRPTRINPLCTMHYKTHVKIGPRKDWTLTDKNQSFYFSLIITYFQGLELIYAYERIALSTLKFWVSSCSYHIIFFKILALFDMEN